MKRLRIECPTGISYQAKITDADTGESIQNVYKVELVLDVKEPVKAVLYMHSVEVDVVAIDPSEQTTPLEVRLPYTEIQRLQGIEEVSRGTYEYLLYLNKTRTLSNEETELFERLKAIWESETTS